MIHSRSENYLLVASHSIWNSSWLDLGSGMVSELMRDMLVHFF